MGIKFFICGLEIYDMIYLAYMIKKQKIRFNIRFIKILIDKKFNSCGKGFAVVSKRCSLIFFFYHVTDVWLHLICMHYSVYMFGMVSGQRSCELLKRQLQTSARFDYMQPTYYACATKKFNSL